MIDESTEDFLHQGIERLYPGQWKVMAPGVASAITADGVGILVTHDRQQGHLAFAAGVLSGMTYSQDLARAVGALNKAIVFGAYVLWEGQPDHWSLTYSIKMRYAWLEPPTRAGAHMVFDALSAVPQFVKRGTIELTPQFGGEPWGIPTGWAIVLMDNF